MDEQIEIELADGKYAYLYRHGDQRALRYGNEWRDLTGDKFIYAMACRIAELSELLAGTSRLLEDNLPMPMLQTQQEKDILQECRFLLSQIKVGKNVSTE